jgi:hypothetical protein
MLSRNFPVVTHLCAWACSCNLHSTRTATPIGRKLRAIWPATLQCWTRIRKRGAMLNTTLWCWCARCAPAVAQLLSAEPRLGSWFAPCAGVWCAPPLVLWSISETPGHARADDTGRVPELFHRRGELCLPSQRRTNGGLDTYTWLGRSHRQSYESRGTVAAILQRAVSAQWGTESP